MRKRTSLAMAIAVLLLATVLLGLPAAFPVRGQAPNPPTHMAPPVKGPDDYHPTPVVVSSQVRPSSGGLKAIAIVGDVESSTQTYKDDMQVAVDTLEGHGVTVHKFFYGDSTFTWSDIVAVADGVNFLLYMGHGVYWGGSCANPSEVGGFSLGNGFVSPDQIRTDLGGRVADDSVAILSHACFSAGDTACDPEGSLTQAEAERRVRMYAEAFVDIGMEAYYANNYFYSASNIADALLADISSRKTAGEIFKSTYPFSASNFRDLTYPISGYDLWLSGSTGHWSDAFVGIPTYVFAGEFSCDAPLTGVSVSGVSAGDVEETLTFTALPDPTEATQPVSYTWSTDGLVSGQGTAETTYLWSTAGSKTVQVTASNCGGYEFIASQAVTISVPAPEPPTLYSIPNSDEDDDYTVDWSTVTYAESYTLQESETITFAHPLTVYTGSTTQYAVSDQSPGTWYYRVRAANTTGESAWSQVESVFVPSFEDAYEPDDTCAETGAITTDGMAQSHTFHDQGDTDWTRFTAVSGTTYIVQATPTGADADLVLALYDACGGALVDSDDNALGDDARLVFQAPASGTYYVKANNHDAETYGKYAAYELAVRTQSPGGVVVIVAGNDDQFTLQDNILYAANLAYRTFRSGGIPKDQIRYLSAIDDVSRTDADGDGVSDVYTTSTSANVEAALTEWAVNLTDSTTPFYLYLVDHGLVNVFKSHGNEDTVRAADLDGWLSTLESTGTPVSVIYEACHSGSFIDGLQEISAPGRVVIASTGRQNDAYPIPGRGAYFSDAFFTALGQSQDLYTSFQWGLEAVTENAQLWQTPWLDDNGNGSPNEAADGDVASGRGLANFSFSGERPPVIEWVLPPADIQDGQGALRAQIRDDGDASQLKVWAIVYPPSFERPEPGADGTLPDLNLPPLSLSDTDQDGEFVGLYEDFTESGTYQALVYAEDAEGNLSQPVSVEIQTGWDVYLPLVIRQQTP